MALLESENLKEVADRSELLQLYGLYKQSVYGDTTMGRPAMADINGLAKWQQWRNLDGVPQEVAQGRYVEMVQQLLQKYKSAISSQ